MKASPAEGPDGRTTRVNGREMGRGGAAPQGTVGSVRTHHEDTAKRQNRSVQSHRRGHKEHVWHWWLAPQASCVAPQ